VKKRFLKVNIEISNICNLQCSFCPEVVRAKKLMELDLFEEIIKQVAPLAEQVCFHLMGDPLVHPKLKEFIELCARHQAKIFFVTNGVLLREPQAKMLLNPAFQQVCFSLHSFFDNFPDRDPSRYLERIFDFTQIALEHREDLYINYRLWNLDDTRVMSEKNRQKNRTMLRLIEERFQIQVDPDRDVKRSKSFKIAGRLYLHFDTEFTWPDLALPVLGGSGTCYGLKNHFGILVDGTVVPCCLDKEGNIPLGNVRDQNVLEILNSPRSQKILHGFQKGHLVEELCRRCQYIDRFGREKSVLGPVSASV
jgi:radical SAM protein with 4Fe4S-binding SPASM domain